MGLAARPWLNHLSPGVHDAMGPAILVSSVVAIAGGAAIAIPGLLRRRAWFFVSFLLVVLLMGIATRTILPRLDPYVSARWYGNFLRDDLHPDRIFTFRLNRSWSYGLNFYLDRELPEWLPSDPEAALVLTTPQGLEEMRRLGRVRGELNEPESGILCVPVYPAPRPR